MEMFVLQKFCTRVLSWAGTVVMCASEGGAALAGRGAGGENANIRVFCLGGGEVRVCLFLGLLLQGIGPNSSVDDALFSHARVRTLGCFRNTVAVVCTHSRLPTYNQLKGKNNNIFTKHPTTRPQTPHFSTETWIGCFSVQNRPTSMNLSLPHPREQQQASAGEVRSHLLQDEGYGG
ncbi:hypothetical protein TraAM80_05974 [Trypanosoma rangeli]|uniref:Uncharacterized protein n=1 Tax=Trypanosoma rangeli TaxID=5698 RepID=A0A3R7MC23_TRYRA|nr:uncharacterized protein TraAM80_05974 [Trypanosoma rangeli]RNF03106.1 hypothetical protein TraAM80_05974 [Trypanosoma rangeli]|eukprot:RNF03106.1 hypothetical protein TraAM80_05974 [Trypanosoma rangeli]